MASLVGANFGINPAEKILLLKTYADTAHAQQRAAEKAVASFADHIKNNRTPENLGKYLELFAEAQEATSHAAELRRKVSEAELAYYNPNNLCLPQDGLGASLADKQVVELDLEESPGYFPE